MHNVLLISCTLVGTGIMTAGRMTMTPYMFILMHTIDTISIDHVLILQAQQF